jgi:transcriptional regulator
MKNNNTTEVQQALLFSFVHEHNFGTLITHGIDGLNVSQNPFFVEFDGITPLLYFHVSMNNIHYQALQKNANITALFIGPSSYISPVWYPNPKPPTWNFQNVQIKGKAIIASNEISADIYTKAIQAEEEMLENSAAKEPHFKTIIEESLKNQAVFQVQIENIAANFHLSQQEDEMTCLGLIRELKKQDNYNSMLLAFEMEQELRKQRKRTA